MNKIISDNWLSKIINKPVYSLQNFNSNILEKDLPTGEAFVWSKISVKDVEKLICLQRLGFYVVDTNAQFNLSRKSNLKNNLNLSLHFM